MRCTSASHPFFFRPFYFVYRVVCATPSIVRLAKFRMSHCQILQVLRFSTTTGRWRIYDPAEHRPLTTRSGRDIRAALLASRSGCAWLLGYPAASPSDAERALKNARETGQPTTLLYALFNAGFDHLHCGNYAAANAQLDELIGRRGAWR
jgi:hypothetical protein